MEYSLSGKKKKKKKKKLAEATIDPGIANLAAKVFDATRISSAINKYIVKLAEGLSKDL